MKLEREFYNTYKFLNRKIYRYYPLRVHNNKPRQRFFVFREVPVAGVRFDIP